MNLIAPLDTLDSLLQRCMSDKSLTIRFQPILDLRAKHIMGYEALTRGPENTPLFEAELLLAAASQYGRRNELETLLLFQAIEQFSQLDIPGQLFCNLSPDSLRQLSLLPEILYELLDRLKYPAHRLTLEVTEGSHGLTYECVRKSASIFKAKGIGIALDDLGEGFSSLRMWSELRPDFIKIDKHFVSGIHADPLKQHFIRSIQNIAEDSHATVIAEGVESIQELLQLRDLGVSLAQGFLIGKPSVQPKLKPDAEITAQLSSGQVCLIPNIGTSATIPRAEKLLIPAPSATPQTTYASILDLLLEHPDLHAIPVVDGDRPVGIILRSSLMESFSRQFSREIYGRKHCGMFMNSNPVLVDKRTPITEFSKLVISRGRNTPLDSFILTDQDRYLGLLSGYDLLNEITEMQIMAARYANPLTMLPGNVPISEHAERLMNSGACFCAAYVDLDYFKSYNDVYGFRRGDAVIQYTANVLSRHLHAELDFLGHIGGDDFLILFQSADWEQRCNAILESFEAGKAEFFKPEHLASQGYFSEDRRGNMVQHPLFAISIGCVVVDPSCYKLYQEVFSQTSAAKLVAKRTPGSSLFIERRSACSMPCTTNSDCNCETEAPITFHA